jgi:hypothetical protein
MAAFMAVAAKARAQLTLDTTLSCVNCALDLTVPFESRLGFFATLLDVVKERVSWHCEAQVNLLRALQLDLHNHLDRAVRGMGLETALQPKVRFDGAMKVRHVRDSFTTLLTTMGASSPTMRKTTASGRRE